MKEGVHQNSIGDEQETNTEYGTYCPMNPREPTPMVRALKLKASQKVSTHLNMVYTTFDISPAIDTDLLLFIGLK
jgi:hypothetical protein